MIEVVVKVEYTFIYFSPLGIDEGDFRAQKDETVCLRL
jgi:hypothetical protein